MQTGAVAALAVRPAVAVTAGPVAVLAVQPAVGSDGPAGGGNGGPAGGGSDGPPGGGGPGGPAGDEPPPDPASDWARMPELELGPAGLFSTPVWPNADAS